MSDSLRTNQPKERSCEVCEVYEKESDYLESVFSLSVSCYAIEDELETALSAQRRNSERLQLDSDFKSFSKIAPLRLSIFLSTPSNSIATTLTSAQHA